METKKIIEALNSLVRLKEYKDKNGEDEHYTFAQSIAWKNASKVLEETPLHNPEKEVTEEMVNFCCRGIIKSADMVHTAYCIEDCQRSYSIPKRILNEYVSTFYPPKLDKEVVFNKCVKCGVDVKGVSGMPLNSDYCNSCYWGVRKAPKEPSEKTKQENDAVKPFCRWCNDTGISSESPEKNCTYCK